MGVLVNHQGKWIMKLKRVGLRVAGILVAVCGLMILVTGTWSRSRGDDEMPMLILAATWGMIMITKPRPKRH